MQIVKATKDQIDWIVRHRVEMFRDMNWSKDDLDATKPLVKKYLKESWDNRIVCFLAIENDQIVGGCAISLFSILPSIQTPSGNHGYIHNLFVEREYRKKGIATRLLKHCINYCKESGVSKCWLHSTDMGLSIYLKAGFEKCENYYGVSLVPMDY